MHITFTFNYVFYEILYVDILKAGCCKPQIICQIQYMNVTFWGKQNIAVDSSYPYNNYFDTWTNDQSMLQVKVFKPGPDRTVRPEKPPTVHFCGSFSIKNRFMGKKQESV